MSKNNQRVRAALRMFDVRQWRLAELLNVREEVLSKKLRKELPDEEQARMIELIMTEAKRAEGDAV